MTTFHELNLDKSIIKAISELGFEEATPIQEQAIPIVLEGGDVIGLAQTGTGKTAAFGVPLLQLLDPKANHVQGLILAPTRELTIQVAEELMRLSKYLPVQVLPIYGGQDIQRQIRALKKNPQIIVGTPGRVLDHIRRKTLKLGQISTVILDEADEMLDMGFQEELEGILSQLPEKRQTLLFSATMATPIRKLADKYLNQPKQVAVASKEMTVASIEQYYLEVNEKEKFDVLCRVLDMEGPQLAIIFGRTKRRVDELSEGLSKRGYFAEGLHGDLSQNQRNHVMKKFKSGQLEILVATDVAARGIDVTGVTHVFNFDLPQTPDSYVHRVGRTGRAGKEGISYTFVTSREMSHLEHISRTTKANIKKQRVPSAGDALEGKQKYAADKLLQAMDEDGIKVYESLAKSLLDEQNSVSLVAAALKILTRQDNQVAVQLTPEAPLRAKKTKSMSRNPRNPGANPRSRERRGGGGGDQRSEKKYDKKPNNKRSFSKNRNT
jgi:ATP-dependent RNA helicase DeaD